MSRKTLLPRPEGEKISWTSSPSAMCETFCGGTDLTSSPFGMALYDATTPIGLRNLASVPVVRWQPWFYLRLVAYGFFGLSEGALGVRDTMSTGHRDTHPRTRAFLRTGWSSSARSAERQRLSCRDAQAACCFSFSASKLSPFFQSVSVIAAIFRASVRRAMAGFMPLASNL